MFNIFFWDLGFFLIEVIGDGGFWGRRKGEGGVWGFGGGVKSRK